MRLFSILNIFLASLGYSQGLSSSRCWQKKMGTKVSEGIIVIIISTKMELERQLNSSLGVQILLIILKFIIKENFTRYAFGIGGLLLPLIFLKVLDNIGSVKYTNKRYTNNSNNSHSKVGYNSKHNCWMTLSDRSYELL